MTETSAFETARYRWTCLPEWEGFVRDTLAPAVERNEDPAPSEEIKSNNVRRVLYLEAECTGSRPLYLKRFKIRNVWGALNYSMFRTKAAKEWETLLDYREAGLPVPGVAFRAEPKKVCTREPSFLALEEISDYRYPNQVLIEEGVDRERFIGELALWVRKLFDAGAVMDDFHPGNVLVQDNGEGWRFNLIDLHDASRGRLSRSREVWGLAKLLGDMRRWLDESDRRAFIETYLGERKDPGLHGAVEKRILREKQRVIKNRTRRCLVESSGYTIKKRNGYRIYLRRAVPKRVKLYALAANDGEWRGPKRDEITVEMILDAVGEARKTHGECATLTIGEIPVHVKMKRKVPLFQSIKDLFQKPRLRRAWVAMCGFYHRRVPGTEAVALVEKRTFGLVRESFLFTRYVENATDLAGYVHRNLVAPRILGEKPDWKKLGALARKLARVYGLAHGTGVVHRDMKGENLLIRDADDGPEVILSDLDSVDFADEVSENRVAWNLAQLAASAPYCVGPRTRMRFFAAYMKESPLREKRKELLSKIADLTEKRIQRWLRIYREGLKRDRKK